jgi:hypothetical protein
MAAVPGPTHTKSWMWTVPDALSARQTATRRAVGLGGVRSASATNWRGGVRA